MCDFGVVIHQNEPLELYEKSEGTAAIAVGRPQRWTFESPVRYDRGVVVEVAKRKWLVLWGCPGLRSRSVCEEDLGSVGRIGPSSPSVESLARCGHVDGQDILSRSCRCD
jgi:hypothetical protein